VHTVRLLRLPLLFNDKMFLVPHLRCLQCCLAPASPSASFPASLRRATYQILPI